MESDVPPPRALSAARGPGNPRPAPGAERQRDPVLSILCPRVPRSWVSVSRAGNKGRGETRCLGAVCPSLGRSLWTPAVFTPAVPGCRAFLLNPWCRCLQLGTLGVAYSPKLPDRWKSCHPSSALFLPPPGRVRRAGAAAGAVGVRGPNSWAPCLDGEWISLISRF